MRRGPAWPESRIGGHGRRLASTAGARSTESLRPIRAGGTKAPLWRCRFRTRTRFSPASWPPMRLRLFILVICAFAVLAAPARADHGVTVVDSTLARYMQIAAAYWNAPEPVCSGQDGEVIYPHAVMADDPTPGVAAWADVGGCHIWLDRDFWPAPPDEQHCNLIAHE